MALVFVISLHQFEIHLYCSPVDTTEDIHMENQARLIRLPEVMKKTGFGKAWIYRLISKGCFPQPVKIGLRAVAFVESEVDNWIHETISSSRNKVS